MSKFKLIILIIFLISTPLVAKGESSSLYFSPSSGSFLVGSTFSVSIFLNTGENKINVVWVDIEFPSDLLQVTSPTAGTSFITEWLTPPSYSNEKGLISFRGGIPGGISTSAGLVSTITFRTVASGVAKIKFTGESKVLLHDGKGTDILTSLIDGEYQALVPPPEGPIVFSPTHPNPDVWYSDSSPSFSWKEENKVTGYSWSFSQNPQESPDGISEGTENMTSFDNIGNGIWYFHVRQQKNGIWGKTSHVQIKADVSPPQSFVPRVITYSRLIGYQTLVYFETNDGFSGMDHYEISLVDLNETEASRSFFTEEISPYKIPFEKAGKYNVIVKAVDRAGNINEEESIFRLVTPFITHIQGEGLEIKGVLLNWWLVVILLLLILGLAVLLILFIRNIVKRRRLT
ncbi:cohesin domain-containing protein [Patescibacteria group bacterium]